MNKTLYIIVYDNFLCIQMHNTTFMYNFAPTIILSQITVISKPQIKDKVIRINFCFKITNKTIRNQKHHNSKTYICIFRKNNNNSETITKGIANSNNQSNNSNS